MKRADLALDNELLERTLPGFFLVNPTVLAQSSTQSLLAGTIADKVLPMHRHCHSNRDAHGRLNMQHRAVVGSDSATLTTRVNPLHH